MSGARYAVACVECERVAFLRTNVPLGGWIYEARKSRQNSGQLYVDQGGFVDCVEDEIFFSYCWNCEIKRAQRYDIPLTTQYGGVYHPRLTHPFLAWGLLKNWPLVARIKDVCSARLGHNTNPRPIFLVDFLEKLWRLGSTQDVEVQSIYAYEEQWRRREGHGLFFPNVV